jgi:uncharacterized protein
MTGIKSIYDKLLDYQTILTEKFKLQEKIDELPKMLSSRTEVLNRLKKSYLSKHTQFKKLEENIYSHERLVGDLNQQKEKLEEKTKIVKGQREYEALFKEIDLAKQKEDEYKFQLLQDQRVINDLRSALEKDEMSIKQQEEEITKEQERINSELSKIKNKLNDLVKTEEKLVSDVDENLRFKFEKIVKNKDGVGIVTVSKGHCNGCFLILPPEFINLVRKDDNIQFCPNCSRILYYDNETDEIFAIDEYSNEEDDSEYFESED